MSADFSRLLQHLADGVDEHVKRDRMNPVQEAVFRARGGQHAPGEVCPSEKPLPPVHASTCYWLISDADDYEAYCNCGVEAGGERHG